ncbi:unnamed protein product [Lathyrus sativus]|nr:unnamed protein product [Lathyrus sativus]
MGVKGFVEGGVASIIAGCFTHSLDLIKVRMQLQGENAPKPNPVQNLRPALAFGQTGTTSIHVGPTPVIQPRVIPISVGVRLVQQEGVRALFSGRHFTPPGWVSLTS